MRSSKIAIFDDHPIFREGLACVLRRETKFDIVDDDSNADVVTVDTADRPWRALSMVARLRAQRDDARILAISGVSAVPWIAAVMRAGATGYALKSQPTEQILEAIGHVRSGKRYLPPEIEHQAVEQALRDGGWKPVQALSPREEEVFELLVRGCTTNEIARELAIGHRTVETHRQRIMNKLPARSLPEMIRIAALRTSERDDP